MQLAIARIRQSGFRAPNVEAAKFLAIKYIGATTEELLALESMPNNCATKLAYAQGQFTSVRMQVERYATSWSGPNDPYTAANFQLWQDWATDLSNRFEVLARQFAAAANTHAAPPTTVELYGEPNDNDYE